MSYLFTLVVSILLVCIIAIPLNSFADQQPVINEFVVHPSIGNKEWVELYVSDGKDVTGYWIDDDTDFTSDSGNSAKKQITSVIQGSDSNHVVFELTSSMFNNDGDTVALFLPDGTLLDQYTYTKDPGVDVAIGRTPDEIGSFQILASATKGNPNSSPQPTNTPTPAPTDKPTKAPKPTEIPTPAKSKTTTSTATTKTNSQTFLADEITSPYVNNSVSLTENGSSSAYPTSILGVSTSSANKHIVKPSKKQVLFKAASTVIPQLIAVIIGGVLFIACGILLYWKRIRKQEV